jgi:hypothetical protein
MTSYTEDLTKLEPNVPYVVNHNLHTTDVVVQVRRISTGQILTTGGPIDVRITGANTLTVTAWKSVLDAGDIRIIVLGTQPQYCCSSCECECKTGEGVCLGCNKP